MAAEQQREQALEDLKGLLGNHDFSRADIAQNNWLSGSRGLDSVTNMYLSDEALGQNTFNNDNNALFIIGNEARGGETQQAPAEFNFALPAQIETDDKKSLNRRSRQSRYHN